MLFSSIAGLIGGDGQSYIATSLSFPFFYRIKEFKIKAVL